MNLRRLISCNQPFSNITTVPIDARRSDVSQLWITLHSLLLIFFYIYVHCSIKMVFFLFSLSHQKFISCHSNKNAISSEASTWLNFLRFHSQFE